MLKLLIALIGNAVALIVAKKFVTGFETTDDWLGLGILILLFTAANSLILPMLRVVLKPFIWLTLGLLAFVLNGALIFAVDILSENITIIGLAPLLWATIIFGLINAFFALGAKAFK